jgi:hypothetical protein
MCLCAHIHNYGCCVWCAHHEAHLVPFCIGTSLRTVGRAANVQRNGHFSTIKKLSSNERAKTPVIISRKQGSVCPLDSVIWLRMSCSAHARHAAALHSITELCNVAFCTEAQSAMHINDKYEILTVGVVVSFVHLSGTEQPRFATCFSVRVAQLKGFMQDNISTSRIFHY